MVDNITRFLYYVLMPKRLTTPEYIAKANSIHGDRWDYSQLEYAGNNKKVRVICKAHGAFFPLANDHLSKRAGCPECAGVKRMTTEQFIVRADIVHGGKFNYSKVSYTNTYTKVVILCPLGHEFLQAPHDHLQGAGCPHCAGTAKVTEQEFLDAAKSIHGDKYDYSRVRYIDFKTPVEIVCRKHNKSFMQRPRQHAAGRGCPICGGVQKDTEGYVVKAIARRGDRYDYSKTVYVAKNVPVTITCKVHGDFQQFPYNHLKGHNCPSCACTETSKPQKLLQDMFSDVPHRTDRVILGGREIDILFHNHNLGVEVNGIYWHSDVVLGDRASHVEKTEECVAKGVRLLHFTDAQINNKPKIVESMIRSRLGLSQKLSARKCTVRKLDFAETRDFFDANHIAGNAAAKVTYGLLLEGRLVSAMSFSTPRFTKDAEWEILRFASVVGITVVGGASKLFSMFVREHNPKSTISYADRRYGEGLVYKQLGFAFVRNTQVGYAYHHKSGDVVSRYQAQKYKLPKLLGDKFDPELSERDNMVRAGYHLIYDCGNALWKYETPS